MAAGSSHEILRLCWLEAIILCLRPNTFQHSASTVSSELALSDLYLDVRCKCFCIILSLTLAFWPDHLPCLTLCVSDFRLQPVETYNPEMASLVGNLKTAITMTMRLTSVCCAQPETHWQTLATGSVPVVPVSVTVRLPVACPDTAVRGLRRAAARQKHFVVGSGPPPTGSISCSIHCNTAVCGAEGGCPPAGLAKAGPSCCGNGPLQA